VQSSSAAHGSRLGPGNSNAGQSKSQPEKALPAQNTKAALDAKLLTVNPLEYIQGVAPGGSKQKISEILPQGSIASEHDKNYELSSPTECASVHNDVSISPEYYTDPTIAPLKDQLNSQKSREQKDIEFLNVAVNYCNGIAKPSLDTSRLAKRPLEEHTITTVDEPSSKRIDTGVGKELLAPHDDSNAPASAPTSEPEPICISLSSTIERSVNTPTKRPLEEPDNQSPTTKRMNTGTTYIHQCEDGNQNLESTPHLLIHSEVASSKESTANLERLAADLHLQDVQPDGIATKSATQIETTTSTGQYEALATTIATREEDPLLPKPENPITSVLNTLSFGQLRCVSCGDIFYPYAAARMPCQHAYCRECLQTVLKNSLIDEAMFPPRCCKQPFSLDDMRRLLTPELISQYGEKKEEFETVDRTYCSNTSCSTFLYPVNISAGENIGIYPVCFTVTCTQCKGIEHLSDCPKDSGMLEVLELAKKEGWQSCKKCHRVIELKQGCNHIT